MFGNGSDFPTVMMSELVGDVTAGKNVLGIQRPIKDGEYAVLKVSAISTGVFRPSEYKVVTNVASIEMVHPHKGDLLFSRANTSEMVGATVIVEKDYDNLFLPDKIWKLEPTPQANVLFLKQLLSTPVLRREISEVATGTSSSMKNISMSKFQNLPAFLPPLSLQREFADFAAEADKSQFAFEQEINSLELAFESSLLSFSSLLCALLSFYRFITLRTVGYFCNNYFAHCS